MCHTLTLIVILLSITVCISANDYDNINGTYTLYQNQRGICNEIYTDVCTPCSIGRNTYYYSINIIRDYDFPIFISRYSDNQCSQFLNSKDIARHKDCVSTDPECSISYRLTEIEYAQLTISSEELMIVGLIGTSHQNDVKVIANSKEFIANGTITGFQAYSSGSYFQFGSRLSETTYNSTLGECNYDEVCTSYPFTYSVSIISRETIIPSDRIFVTFLRAGAFSVTDTDEEYIVNSRKSDQVVDPVLEFVVKKGDEIPTSFPGVTFYSPPKTGDHLQQITNVELIPQENGEFYHLKYIVDWYHTFPFISNCSITTRIPQYNNEYILCSLAVRSVEFPVDFDKEKALQSPDEMSFQLF